MRPFFPLLIRLSRAIIFLLLLTLFFFICIGLQKSFLPSEESKPDQVFPRDTQSGDPSEIESPNIAPPHTEHGFHPRKTRKTVPLRGDVGCARSSEKILNVSKGGEVGSQHIRNLFYLLNKDHCVRNAIRDANGKLDVQYVVLVMVHDRAEYLKLLVESIEKQSSEQHLNKTLVIFSHDMYSKEVFDIVEKITQFQVLQIGFPYSRQIFAHSFPGESPDDCPRDVSRIEARKLKCVNADYPDRYGHYREAKFTAIKHHWWWKLNYVMKSIVGHVFDMKEDHLLLIEEDHYLAPDALQFVAELMQAQKQMCPNCALMQIGDYMPVDKTTPLSKFNDLRVDEFYSSRNNMGIVVRRETFQVLTSEECALVFCKYDDYNWDWSLNQQGLNLNCFPTPHPRMLVLVPLIPRILHTGKCGVHSHNSVSDQSQCDAKSLIEEFLRHYPEPLRSAASSAAGAASSLNLVNTPQRPRAAKRSLTPNGGWADPRDHKFCLKIAENDF